MELDTNFFSRCESALKEAAKEQSKQIAQGNAESFSEYKMAVGRIQGLNSALYILEEVLTIMSKEQR